MKSLFKRYKYASPNVSSIEYFQNPSLHHGGGICREFFSLKHSNSKFMKTVRPKKVRMQYYKTETVMTKNKDLKHL